MRNHQGTLHKLTTQKNTTNGSSHGSLAGTKKTADSVLTITTKSDIDNNVDAVENASKTETLKDMAMAVKATSLALREARLALEESRIALKDERSRTRKLEQEILELTKLKKKIKQGEEQEKGCLRKYLSLYAGDSCMCDEDCEWCGRCKAKLQYASDYVQRQFELVKERLLHV